MRICDLQLFLIILSHIYQIYDNNIKEFLMKFSINDMTFYLLLFLIYRFFAKIIPIINNQSNCCKNY